jgi:hypothetical protein
MYGHQHDQHRAAKLQDSTEEMIRMREPRHAAPPKAEDAHKLRLALLPFVLAYAEAADPIGDSDLYNEQPRSVSVTLGDCRKAAALLGIYPKVKP